MIHRHTDIDGTVVEFQMPDPEPQPLDEVSALATLLVVDGVISLSDASLAIHQSEQALTDEALAWSLGA